ncbi:MAG: MobF family relaxase [Inquilinus sp.]|uniref:MobF family relaxase n=1 Tax=Inquilinus sp. TaxID=1932117 RepID=UPI003F326D7E
MLTTTVLTRQDGAQLASYYEDGVDDYYAKEGEASAWQGRAAEILKLSGPVDPRDFRMMLDGHIALGVYARTASNRHDSKERLGIDLTFSAPKSVSIQAFLGGDERIISAHDLAVARALEHAEERAQARAKLAGRSQTEVTGNLAIAKWRHETSREQDPQLHTHAVVMNFTRRSDGQWRALKNDEIVKSTKYLGAVYRTELAAELQKIGYELRHDPGGTFELAHISRQQIEAFSRRSRQVEANLAARGLDRDSATAGQKQVAALSTRERKVSVEREALYRRWNERAREAGIVLTKPEVSVGVAHDDHSPWRAAADAEAAKRAVAFAVAHHTERQAILTRSELVDTALKQGMGKVRLATIDAEVERRMSEGNLIREAPLYRLSDAKKGEPGKTARAWSAELVALGIDAREAPVRTEQAILRGRLVPAEARYTTQTALAREKAILALEAAGRGAATPIMPAETVRARIAASGLTRGQADAVETILSSPDRIVGVQGLAGTGKTTMLKTAAAALKAPSEIATEEGYQVRAIASYGSQVRELRREGFEANTLAAFLNSKDKGINDRTVLVLDEAGVVPARLMERFLRTAEEAGVRVVLLGDTAQTKAIEAGRPFDQLQAAGMRTARMEEIQRQRDPELRDAVRLAAFGDTDAALTKLHSVRELQDDAERRAAIVADYMALSPAERDRTLILAITNEARFELNGLVREATGLDGRGQEFDALIRRDTTQAERRHARNYHRGDLIQPEKDYPRLGLARGSLYEVVETGPGNRLDLRAPDGDRVEVSPANLKKLSVYEPARLEFAVGDAVRTTRNDPALDVTNGDRFRVARIDAEARNLVLEDGRRQVVLDTSKPLHLDHAYAMTVHGAQGATVDRVLFEANTKPRTLARDVFYTGLSRPRLEARIYTDDRTRLPETIRKDTEKHAAMDLAGVERQRLALEAGDRARPDVAEPERQADRPEIKSPAAERQRDDGFQR